MINCPTCEKFDGHDCELFGRQPGMAICHYAVERKPRNHFEAIKAMSMEEMAVWLASIGPCPEVMLNKFWREWLKEEVKDA